MRAPNLIATALFVSAAALLVRDRSPDLPGPAPVEPASQPGGEAQPEWPASLAFEPNQGQTDPRVRFLARGPDYTLFLTDTGLVARLASAGRGEAVEGAPGRPHAVPGAVIGMTMANANPAPRVTGELPQPGASHYFIGNDPSGWQRNVSHFGRVRYEGVYAGIDAVYYGADGELEYDFVVAPGADPGEIALDFSGVDALSLDASGNLVLDTGEGAVVQHRPVVYQVVDGVRRLVDGAYRLMDEDTVGFVLGAFDRTLPLTIDPVLTYSTYLGGDAHDKAHAFAIDEAGNTWVVGETTSTVFPWEFDLDSEYSGGDGDAYVCRFRAVGGIPLCAYIGGEGYDSAEAVTIGEDGNAYVGGYTESMEFPVLDAIQPTRAAGEWGDAFILKINDAQNGLEFSTYLGGGGADEIRALAPDAGGGVYATGHTWSWNDFPVTQGAFQTGEATSSDAFVTRITASGGLAASTRLGGTLDDFGRGITVDRAGRVSVAGHTLSSDFPVKAPVQGGQAGGGDAFLAKFDANLSSLLYGTYLGGSGLEWAYEVRLDDAGNIHVAGNTASADFPLASPLQPSFGGGEQDGFLVKIAPNGATLRFSTYLGGSDFDDVRHVQLDAEGNVYVAGYTSSTDFPLSGSLQPVQDRDAVLLKLTPDGSKLLSGTAIGGTDTEVLTGMVLDIDGNAVLGGWTYSTDLPVAGAFQGTYANEAMGTIDAGADMFLTKLGGNHLSSWAGDFNGDGVDDILWRNNATGQGSIWHSANARTVANISRINNLQWRIAGVGDFDGDGRSDIFWRNAATGANTVWRSGDSRTSVATTSVSNTNWEVHGIGDFDADGTDDIVWHDVTTGETALWHGADSDATTSLFRIGNLAWDIVGAGDFDGDGRDDLLWRNPVTGQNVAWLGGDYLAQYVVAGVAGQAWRIVGIGDFQGDGKDDLLWRNVVEGRNTIWRGASSAQSQAVAGVVRQTWQIQGTGDYNGDGKADLLWRDNWRGANTIWRSGTASTPQAVTGVSNQAWTPKS